ncbi:hypothetical protein BJV77DRAFT_1064681 [Russula vinacea]|nr:hypothetical protein BJV77DRAFT_1064681 [Russula vinacea]
MGPNIPLYQVQPLISSVLKIYGRPTLAVSSFNTAHRGTDNSDAALDVEVKCAQAFVGCSNGEVLLFALQANEPDQMLPTGKPVDEIVLTPSISRALVLSDRQIFFFVIPSLELLNIKPIRNVMAFAVDHRHIFCVVKRTGVALYSLRESLKYLKEIPLQGGAFLARRIGLCLCIADREFYSLVSLDAVTATQLLPISQIPQNQAHDHVDR